MDSNVLRSLPETGTSRFTSDNEQSLAKKETGISYVGYVSFKKECYSQRFNQINREHETIELIYSTQRAWP